MTRTTLLERPKIIAAGSGVLLAGALALGTSAAGSVVPADASSAAQVVGRDHQSRCSTRVEDRNLAAFERYYDLLTSGRGEEAMSYFSDDAVVEVHGSVPYEGVYAVAEYAATAQQYWQRPTEAPAQAPTWWADCDQVVQRGAFDLVSVATGIRADTEVIEVFTFDADGSIVRDDLYFVDTAAINAVLGAS